MAELRLDVVPHCVMRFPEQHAAEFFQACPPITIYTFKPSEAIRCFLLVQPSRLLVNAETGKVESTKVTLPVWRTYQELANRVRLNNWIHFQSGKCRAEISAIPFISKSARPQLKREYFSKCRRPVTTRKAIENRLKSRNHSFLPTNL
jgi:hypothetical protein